MLKLLLLKNQWFTTISVYLTMVIIGLFAGYSNIVILQELGLLIADVFIKIFKCISMPIIALSIIVTLGNYKTTNATNIWRRTILYTLSTTLIAALISCLLYYCLQPQAVSLTVNAVVGPQTNKLTYFQHISSIIPTTILSPFLEHQVMGVLLFGIVIGIAIPLIPDHKARETIKSFFQGMHGLFMVITGWVIKIIPLGIFGFITTSVIQFHGVTQFQGLGKYLLIIVLANLIQGCVILPLWLKIRGINPLLGLKSMLPALAVAFFSKSSTGTLPVTMSTAEKNWQIKPEISRFVLPLCTSLNMNGCAAFIFITVIYLMQNNGIDISLAAMFLWVIIATVAAVGNAGVPMGCFFLSASLLTNMNVPIVLMGIILPFYSLIDMLETALNVWSDSCIAKVVNERSIQEVVCAKELLSNGVGGG